MVASAILVAPPATLAQTPVGPGEDSAPALDQWEVRDGFRLQVDVPGFSLPSAIAIVPNPGPGPKDPYYFVTELRGRIRVVTNDRTVYTFAEGFFEHRPAAELPDMEGESGLAGICLDPERGYVFATFVNHDAGGILRNDVARFETTPGTFDLSPAGMSRFTDVFAPFESFISHQIGSCRVSGEHLYVTVGDARQTALSQDTTALLGKMLRLTVEGEPAAGNPFPDAGPGAAVWAYGLRNPFGATLVGEQPYVVDNGSGVDRLIRIERGRNYLWDGTDQSIGIGAEVLIMPSVGPAHVAYAGEEALALPPSLRGGFLVALSRMDRSGILRLPYDVERQIPLGVPETLVRHRGEGQQVVAAIAVAPDAVLFAPMLPGPEGTSPVLALTYDEGAPHPHVILDDLDAAALWETGSCLGCHQRGGVGGTLAPTLDRDSLALRIRERLSSDEYRSRLQEAIGSSGDTYGLTEAEGSTLLDSTEHDALVLWTRTKLLDPRFDQPNSGMPNPGLSRAQATVLARDLLGPSEGLTPSLSDRFWDLFPRPPRLRHLALFGVLGFVLGMLTIVVARRARSAQG